MLQFERPALAEQFSQLRRHNAPLALVLECLGQLVWRTLRKNVVVTSVLRTMRQQQTTYGRGTKKVSPRTYLQQVDLRPWVADAREIAPLLARLRRSASPHMFWHAVDVRLWTYAPKEIAAILAFLRQYDAHNLLPIIQAAGSRTVWLHEAGSREPHLHVQYKGPPLALFDFRRTPY